MPKTKKKVRFDNNKSKGAKPKRPRKKPTKKPKKPKAPKEKNNTAEVNTTGNEEKVKKIKDHISFCVDLSDAYRKKHEEVKKLTKYLKNIAENMSKKPIGDTDIKEFLHRISDVALPTDLNTKKVRLAELKARQKMLLKDATKKYGSIDKKMKELKKKREIKTTKKRVEVPVKHEEGNVINKKIGNSISELYFGNKPPAATSNNEMNLNKLMNKPPPSTPTPPPATPPAPPTQPPATPMQPPAAPGVTSNNELNLNNLMKKPPTPPVATSNSNLNLNNLMKPPT